MLFHSLKNPIPNSKDILTKLDKLQEKIPSCKSILPQNLL